MIKQNGTKNKRTVPDIRHRLDLQPPSHGHTSIPEVSWKNYSPKARAKTVSAIYRRQSGGMYVFRSSIGKLVDMSTAKQKAALLHQEKDDRTQQLVTHYTEPTHELSEEFIKLKKQWQEGAAHHSMLYQQVLHPAYQRIIGLGPKVIPLILQDLENEPEHWDWALRALTGADPVPREEHGDLERIAKRWLEWGKIHGII